MGGLATNRFTFESWLDCGWSRIWFGAWRFGFCPYLHLPFVLLWDGARWSGLWFVVQLVLLLVVMFVYRLRSSRLFTCGIAVVALMIVMTCGVKSCCCLSFSWSQGNQRSWRAVSFRLSQYALIKSGAKMSVPFCYVLSLMWPPFPGYWVIKLVSVGV